MFPTINFGIIPFNKDTVAFKKSKLNPEKIVVFENEFNQYSSTSNSKE